MRPYTPLPPCGRGAGGEGNTVRLFFRACAGKNHLCLRDSVPNRCTLVWRVEAAMSKSERIDIHKQEFTLRRRMPYP